MTYSEYQRKVTAPDGTKLVSKPLADDCLSVCTGCYFEDKSCVDLRFSNSAFECDAARQGNMNGIVWIELEKEQPVSKHDAIKEIRAKTITLQNEIYKLVEAFEADTDMVVHGINLDHAYVINSANRTYNIELDVRLK